MLLATDLRASSDKPLTASADDTSAFCDAGFSVRSSHGSAGADSKTELVSNSDGNVATSGEAALATQQSHSAYFPIVANSSVAPTPLIPFARTRTLGSLISASIDNPGFIAGGGFTDFEVYLEPEETIAAIASPSNASSLSIQLVGVSPMYPATTAGESVQLPSTPITIGGFYLIRIASDFDTNIDLDVYRNAAIDDLAKDTDSADPAPISNSSISLGTDSPTSRRYGVIGESTPGSDPNYQWSQYSDSGKFIDISGLPNTFSLESGEQIGYRTEITSPLFSSQTGVIGSRGYVTEQFTNEFLNGPLPTEFVSTGMFPFLMPWGDADVSYTDTVIDGIPTFVVQWTGLHDGFPGPSYSGEATFQIQIFDSGPTLARFAYADVDFNRDSADSGAEAVIGYQRSEDRSFPFSTYVPSVQSGDVLDLLPAPQDDVDEYVINLHDKRGTSIDIALSGIGAADFANETLELIGPDGLTVLATATSDALNADLFIDDFVVPLDGVYTIRLGSQRTDELYSLTVTESADIETEPNEIHIFPSQNLEIGKPVLAHVDQFSDLSDAYEISLSSRQSVRFEVKPLFRAVEATPPNTVNLAIDLISSDGTTVFASDLQSLGNANYARIDFVAHEAANYKLRVTAASGQGEYLVTATEMDFPGPEVYLNELLHGIGTSSDNPDEYIELLGQPGESLDDVYLIFVEGDSEENLGQIQGPNSTAIIDLSGTEIGESGQLVIIDESNHPYFISPESALFDVPGFEIESGSWTAMLVYVDPALPGTAPALNQDLDTGNNGLDQLPDGWRILDRISILDGNTTDRAYARAGFSPNALGIPERGGFIRGATFDPAQNVHYVLRPEGSISESVVSWYAFQLDTTGVALPYRSVTIADQPGYDGMPVSTHIGLPNPRPWQDYPSEDFGDAPSPYPTTLADNGARHIAVGPSLGSRPDIDPDGQPSLAALGDDDTVVDDEDGVSFPSVLLGSPTNPSATSVGVDLQNPSSTTNVLDAWIDFNADGDWNDPGEQILSSYNLGTSAGIQTVPFNVPQIGIGNFVEGFTVARFRISETGGLSPLGQSISGEVEDHLVALGSQSTLVVDSLGDVTDGDFTPGNLTLREAIELANAAAGSDHILISPHLIGETILLSQGALNVSDDVTIEGPGSDHFAVSGNNVSRVFVIESDTTVGISGLEITEGNTPVTVALAGGAGVFSSGNLTLTDVRISDSHVDAPAAEGGGLKQSGGSLTLVSSSVTNNSTSGSSTGGGGGGIYAEDAIVTITLSTITDNVSFNAGAYGAGLSTNGGELNLRSSTVDGNMNLAEDGFGGGILTLETDTEIFKSTISNNVSANGGGGITHFAISEPFRVFQSTISGNSADFSGGIHSSGANAWITQSTITRNTAAEKGAGIGRLKSPSDTISLESTIVAGNVGLDIHEQEIITAPSIFAFNSLGFNVIGTGNDAVNSFSQLTDLVGIADPKLSDLADNGGPTKTHALLPGSAAIDSGNNSTPDAYDQRGIEFPRQIGGGVDAGSIESSYVGSALRSLVINEILVDASEGAFGFDTNRDGEVDQDDDFIEIFNGGQSSVDLSGLELWSSELGQFYTFANGVVIAPGGFVVITANQSDGLLPRVAPGSRSLDARKFSGLASSANADLVLFEPATNSYLQSTYGDADPGNPTAGQGAFSGFSGTATRSGPIVEMGNASSGQSIALFEDGNTQQSLLHHDRGLGNVAATPGSANRDAAPLDYGDAPLPYPTLRVDDGARHQPGGPTLGASVDTELDGFAYAGILGDDLTDDDDEDGVLISPLTIGDHQASISIDVAGASGGVLFDAWIDFNADGTFGGPWERIANHLPVVDGSHTITFAVPSWARPGETVARLRISSDGTDSPTGFAADGEVEDHTVVLQPISTGTMAFGSGQFIGTFNSPATLFVSDINGDGHSDIQVGSRTSGNLKLFSNDGNEVFAEQTLPAVNTAARETYDKFVVDMDGDGDLDILQSGRFASGPQWASVLVNEGNGTYTPVTLWSKATAALHPADMDGDGDLDIVAGHFNGVSYWRNDGDWNFTETALGSIRSRHVDLADIDRDGHIDIVYVGEFSSGAQNVYWLRNDGDGTFSGGNIINQFPDEVSGMEIVDFNGDGFQDIVFSDAASNSINWLENVYLEEFQNSRLLWRTFETSDFPFFAVEIADVDGNGVQDVVTSDALGLVIYFRNEIGNYTKVTLDDAIYLDIFAGDIDGDGDLDIAANHENGDIYWFENQNQIPLLDFGDAPTSAQSGFPSSYPVTLAQDGARHELTPGGARMGVFIDHETDGIPAPVAFGDDNSGFVDDEDGWLGIRPIQASTLIPTTASVTLALRNADPRANFLDGWIDFNQDGDWDDPGEQIFQSYDLGKIDADQIVEYVVPQDTGDNFQGGTSYARFRLSSSGGLTPTGPAIDGEVEDQPVFLGTKSTLVVDTLIDESDGDFSAGDFSLREAIEQANANQNPAELDEITFDPSLSGGTLTLTLGQLVITESVGIQGLGAENLTISGNNLHRAFEILPVAPVILDGLTITEARTSTSGFAGLGGAIRSYAHLEIRNSVLTDNQTFGQGGHGGAIHQRPGGSLVISDSSIEFNEVHAANTHGAGIHSLSPTTILRSSVSNNTIMPVSGNLNSGAGMLIFQTDLTIIDSTFIGNSNNASPGDGGAFYHLHGNLDVDSSLFANNFATRRGGGLIHQSNLSDSLGSIVNSTVTGNTAGLRGGGIEVADGALWLRHSTVSGNSAPAGQGSGLVAFSNEFIAAEIHVESSIIAGNVDSDVDYSTSVSEVGLISSSGYNLIGTGSAIGVFTEPGDVNGIDDPRLANLNDNGGPTRTQMPLPGSPAINAGGNSSDEAYDQRGEGFARLVGNKVDIGAFETQLSPSPLSQLVINEILADPGTGISGLNTDSDLSVEPTDEFIELYNSSDQSVDVSNLEFWDRTAGRFFSVPHNTHLAAGGFLLLVSNTFGGSLPAVPSGSHAFEAASGSSIFDDSGDNLVVYDPRTNQYLQATYGNVAKDNPADIASGYSGFVITASQIGPDLSFGVPVPGVSAGLHPDGDVGVVLPHNLMGEGKTNASPGSPNLSTDPTISIAIESPSSVAEDGVTDLQFRLSRDANILQALTVNLTFAGSASSTDFTTASTTTATFLPGKATAIITVSPVSDTTVEPDETVVVTIAPSVDYVVDASDSATGTITDNDTATLSIEDVSETEGDAMEFAVTLSHAVEGGLEVDVDFTSQSATGGSDFDDAMQQLTFTGLAGEIQTFTVDTTDDNDDEGTETFLASLSTTAVRVDDSDTATGEIIDNDQPIIDVSVSAPSIAEDSDESLVYTFTRTNIPPDAPALLVHFATTGTAVAGFDFTGTLRNVTFAEGSSTATVRVRPIADKNVEPDETVELQITADPAYTIGTNASAAATITNDDFSLVSVDVDYLDTVEDAATGVTFRFTRTGVFAQTPALDVQFGFAGSATYGTDYSADQTSNVHFATGEKTAFVTMIPSADAIVESDETVIVQITDGPEYDLGVNASATSSILDDDANSHLPYVRKVLYYNQDVDQEAGRTSDETGQRSIIRKIQVELSQPAIVPLGSIEDGSFTLESTSPGTAGQQVGLEVLDSQLVEGRQIITLGFTGTDLIEPTTWNNPSAAPMLVDGTYQLKINGTILGNDANGSEESGVDLIDEFHRLFGDLDADRDVDNFDQHQFRLRSLTGGMDDLMDFDNDDVRRDVDDLVEFSKRYRTTLEPRMG